MRVCEGWVSGPLEDWSVDTYTSTECMLDGRVSARALEYGLFYCSSDTDETSYAFAVYVYVCVCQHTPV